MWFAYFMIFVSIAYIGYLIYQIKKYDGRFEREWQEMMSNIEEDYNGYKKDQE